MSNDALKTDATGTAMTGWRSKFSMTGGLAKAFLTISRRNTWQFAHFAFIRTFVFTTHTHHILDVETTDFMGSEWRVSVSRLVK